MNGVNKAVIIGRVGQDPEIRHMPNGTAVANLSLATSERWKDKDTGEQKESTEWHKCCAFGRTAEIIEQYVKKGDPIYVEGKLQTRSWEKEGQKHYSTEIVIKDMQMLGSKPNQATSPQSSPNAQQGSDSSQSGNDDPLGDSAIPF